MRFLFDMNLSPLWVETFRAAGYEALHWREVGRPNASDREIMAWAHGQQYVVITHDLDFGAILAATHREGPSVIQVRARDIAPDAFAGTLLSVLRGFEDELKAGALLSLDEDRARVRLLPL